VKGRPSPLLIELPAYQMPMLRDVLRTAGMQSWWFIKRAGTVILLANVVLWALMYYPKNTFSLLEEHSSRIGGVGMKAESNGVACSPHPNPLPGGEGTLETSYAAKIGRFFEPVSQYAGFDWRDNVALIGGIAAKEVIVSSMVTMYKVEGDDQDERLALRLHSERGWTPFKAFAMLLFVMLYSPCAATCIVIWRETRHIKYMLAAILYTNTLAFGLAVVVYQLGNFLFLLE
jgi:ferrous iron transport protein B